MPLLQTREFFIQWHLTERCNLRCTHCYQQEQRPGEMSLPEAAALIEEAAATFAEWHSLYGIDFTPSFSVTGGEPLLYAGLFPLLELLREKEFPVHLLTNGTLVDREAAVRIKEAGVRTVQVSVEGPAAIHEAIRGPESFGAAISGVAHLLENGLTVTLNTTLSRVNAASFPELLELAASLGVQRLGFSRLVPAGRGEELREQALSREELRLLYERIFGLNTRGVELVTGDPVAASMRQPEATVDCGDFPMGGCAAGVSGLTILPDGTATPCRRLPIPIGNLRHQALREIWAGSEVLNQLRDRTGFADKCRSCNRWAVCRGCRAIAMAMTGDWLADDPHCFL